MTNEKTDVASRIAELEAIEDEQARIDCVAEDLSTGTHRYAIIDVWTLGELLGVYFQDSGGGDWGRVEYGYKGDLDNDGGEFPLAENVELLDGEIPKARYRKLVKLAEALIEKGEGEDLPLTADEEAILSEKYETAHHSDCGPTLAMKRVFSTSRVELCFEGTLSDGYPDGDAWSPYDLAKGDGFDSSDFVMLDD